MAAKSQKNVGKIKTSDGMTMHWHSNNCGSQGGMPGTPGRGQPAHSLAQEKVGMNFTSPRISRTRIHHTIAGFLSNKAGIANMARDGMNMHREKHGTCQGESGWINVMPVVSWHANADGSHLK